jgi:hypothetical protein
VDSFLTTWFQIRNLNLVFSISSFLPNNCPHNFPSNFNHISVDSLHIPTTQILLESQDSGLLDALLCLVLILNNWLVI